MVMKVGLIPGKFPRFRLKNLKTEEPVSYTHLDVYKRQGERQREIQDLKATNAGLSSENSLLKDQNLSLIHI